MQKKKRKISTTRLEKVKYTVLNQMVSTPATQVKILSWLLTKATITEGSIEKYITVSRENKCRIWQILTTADSDNSLGDGILHLTGTCSLTYCPMQALEKLSTTSVFPANGKNHTFAFCRFYMKVSSFAFVVNVWTLRLFWWIYLTIGGKVKRINCKLMFAVCRRTCCLISLLSCSIMQCSYRVRVEPWKLHLLHTYNRQSLNASIYKKSTCFPYSVKLSLLYLSCRWPPNAHTNANANELTTFPVSLAEIPELCLLLTELTDCRCFWFIIWIWLSSSSRSMCRSKMAER